MIAGECDRKPGKESAIWAIARLYAAQIFEKPFVIGFLLWHTAAVGAWLQGHFTRWKVAFHTPVRSRPTQTEDLDLSIAPCAERCRNHLARMVA